MKHGRAVVLTFIFFMSILYFGLNQVEREANKLVGIDSPPESFTLNIEEEEIIVLTFVGTDYPLSITGVKEIIVSPGQLMHTFWQRFRYYSLEND